MPAQILIRKLTRAQVDKAVAESPAKDRLALRDEDGQLLVAAKQAFPADPIANKVLQQIADADSALIMAERDAARS